MKWIMRSTSIALMVMSLAFFSACSSSKEAKSIRKSISGNWTLQTVDVEGINSKFKAKVFNEADFNCFIGSNWNLVANNGTGTYTLASGAAGCDPVTRNIRWSIYEPEGADKEFQFKRLDDKKNPLDDNNGFRLKVGTVTDNSMQLRSAITFEGKPGTFIYNFVKR